MDIAAIMALIVKGLGVVSTLIAVGRETAPAIKVLIDLAKGAENGDVTPEQLASTEALLDSMIAEFNEPMTD